MKATGCVILVAVALIAVCCGNESSSTAPTPTTLAGTWKATRAEFVNASNSGQRVEAVSQGMTIVLTLQSSGAYTQQSTAPGEPTQTTTGTWTSSRDILSLRPTGMSWNIEFDMTMNGNTLTLSGGHVQFDVNNDEQDEETILNMVMTRQ